MEHPTTNERTHPSRSSVPVAMHSINVGMNLKLLCSLSLRSASSACCPRPTLFPRSLLRLTIPTARFISPKATLREYTHAAYVWLSKTFS